jgi:hypothetical protein
MTDYDGTFKQDKPIDGKYHDFLNAVPHLLKVDAEVLEEILEIKKTAVFVFNPSVMKKYPDKNPAEVEQIKFREHKQKIVDLIEKSKKRFEKKVFNL